jgi:hypothetical protein
MIRLMVFDAFVGADVYDASTAGLRMGKRMPLKQRMPMVRRGRESILVNVP